MIRDYLYQISNIIYDHQVGGSGIELGSGSGPESGSGPRRVPRQSDPLTQIRHHGSKAQNHLNSDPVIQGIIASNDILLKIIQSRDPRSGHRGGAGELEAEIAKLSEKVKGLEGVNEQLSELLANMKSEEFTELNKKIIEIGEVAIVLIQFLGEMISLTNNKDLETVQDQIATITLSLEKYLKPEPDPKPK